MLLFSASSHGKKASVFFLGAYAYVCARVCVVCVPTKASKLRASQVVVIVDVREREKQLSMFQLPLLLLLMHCYYYHSYCGSYTP